MSLKNDKIFLLCYNKIMIDCSKYVVLDVETNGLSSVNVNIAI